MDKTTGNIFIYKPFRYFRVKNHHKIVQVWQWIVAQGQGMERYASAFASRGVDGALLVTLTSRDLKLLGVTGDDKQRLKRKLKELRSLAEKERRIQDKHDKMLKKAEKRNLKKK